MDLPLKWEFPGGKMENEESAEECIIREIQEELNIEIELVRKLLTSKFNYPNISIELIPFEASYKSGKIKLLEHSQYRLLKKAELKDLDWAAADIPVLNEFLKK